MIFLSRDRLKLFWLMVGKGFLINIGQDYFLSTSVRIFFLSISVEIIF